MKVPFEYRMIDADGIRINCAIGGEGPPVLLLHGYPQTHVIWHQVAPALAATHTVVIADLRGYGDSDKPAGGPDHAEYSKRAMARDQVLVMRELGFDRFSVVGHDRGGRVGHRLALDYPEAVERLIGGGPEYWIRARMTARHHGGTAFDPAAMGEYIRCFSDPAAIHASCEDYRAAATIDLTHDDESFGRPLTCPVLALWGASSFVGATYDVLDAWSDYATDLQGSPIPSDHYLPEEAPTETTQALLGFLTS